MSSKHDTDRYGPLPKGAAGLAMVTGAVAGVHGGTALAQDGATADDQEIIVTGSRISRIEGETASPVQILGEEVIEESGATTLGELIQKLPDLPPREPWASMKNEGWW